MSAEVTKPRPPSFGELCPPWKALSPGGEPVLLQRLAGRPLLAAFLGSLAAPPCAEAWRTLRTAPALKDARAWLVGLSLQPGDIQGPDAMGDGWTVALDEGGAISRAWGVSEGDRYAPRIWLLDRHSRVLSVYPIDKPEAALEGLAKALEVDAAENAERFAPVLLAPRIFEPELCQALVQVYQQAGGEVSGFMREIDGKTHLMHDPNHKRRKDADIADPKLRNACQVRIHDRLGPLLQQAFGWRPTRMERYIVARYGAEEQGFFRAHRDNTTAGTAHRKFAVTINLNAAEYDGGDLRFPEFGPRTYRAPTGGAVVFNCSLLHEATPVTRGERFAFLPFLYDEEGARIRERNSGALADPRLRYAAGRTEGERTPEPAEA